MWDIFYYTVAQPVDVLGSAAVVSIKMASMKGKAQCIFRFHEMKSPWTVLQQGGVPPPWWLLVRHFWYATFPKRWIGRDRPKQ
jgi:hypothetical protein